MRRFTPLLGILFLAACTRTGSVVGSWDVGGAEVSWPGSTATLTFSATEGANDGQLIAVFEGPQKVNGLDLIQTFRCKGTYSIQGDTLKCTYTDIEAGVKGLDAAAEKRFQEAMAEQKAGILDSLNAQPSGEIKWKDADTFEYRTDVVATFRRRSP